MRPDTLRTRAPPGPALALIQPRLSSDDRLYPARRMAEIGAVYDAAAAPRTVVDILAYPRRRRATSPPRAGRRETNGCTPASSLPRRP